MAGTHDLLPDSIVSVNSGHICVSSAWIKADDSHTDSRKMISARADRLWRWYQAGGTYVALVGGGLMLLAAAILWASASVPLLVIGGGWLVLGLGGAWQWRRVAREVRLEGELITFVFPAQELTIPAADVLEIRRARWDTNQVAWLRFETMSHGTIKVAARLRGLFELLSELRRLNPQVKYPDF